MRILVTVNRANYVSQLKDFPSKAYWMNVVERIFALYPCHDHVSIVERGGHGSTAPSRGEIWYVKVGRGVHGKPHMYRYGAPLSKQEVS